MKKKLITIISMIAVVTMLAFSLAACGGSNDGGGTAPAPAGSGTAGGSGAAPAPAPASSGSMKIGVLVADVSGEEAQGFRNYYENYIAPKYDVQFVYTEQLTDAASEKSAIEKFASQGCSAILSFSSSDRALQIETCEENQIYYAVASGMLDNEQYEKYKGYEYFVGQIGPSMDTEYQAGYEMGKYFADKGAKKVAMYGAFIPNPMHVYRAAGVLAGIGATYGGASDEGGIVGQIFADQGIDLSKVGANGVELVNYFQGYGDTTADELNAAIQAKPDAFLSVGMATTFFAQQLSTAGIDFSDIDSFTAANNASMKDGTLVYLAGKYSSSIGPIFAAVYDAVNGNVVRDNDGNAMSISQGFRIATSAEEFDELVSKDSGDNPIFSKEILDTVISDKATYDDFVALVENN
ncbi:MAG: substrate-binding domain-containing protein [Parasporobacterium sp.]|nr:substrate-binding domain-containing protein [Parasporobacterium sp.]